MFLGLLDLSGAHRDQLLGRGLTAEQIRAGQYRTLTLDGRARLAARVVELAGDVAGVPGFYAKRDGDREWLSLAGSPGLLIPARDLEGRIVSLKVRRDDPGDGPRYLYVSSAKHGGASAENAVHVPRIGARGGEIRITEGELKADSATALSGVLTVSVPGVGAWRSALPIVAALKPARVRVAFDADWREKPAVARAALDLSNALRRAGHRVALETWSSGEKGIDDHLRARRAGRARRTSRPHSSPETG